MSDMTASSLPPASFWRRLGAMIYDTVVIAAIWILVGFVVTWIFGIEETRHLEGTQVVLTPGYRMTLFASMLLSAYLFFAWFWTHSGQTIGMQAWKIKIQNRDGSAIGYKQSLIRVLLGALSIFPFCLLGHLLMFSNSRRNSFHDRISDSVVVKLP